MSKAKADEKFHRADYFPLVGHRAPGLPKSRCASVNRRASPKQVPWSIKFEAEIARSGRSTCARRLGRQLADGVHPKVAQERLGHSTITTTMDLYSHVTAIMQTDAAARVDAAFRAAKARRKGQTEARSQADFATPALAGKQIICQILGEVAERLNAPHSKCGIRVTVSGVRIPPSPPYQNRLRIEPPSATVT
jgi:hypothetical protein